MAIVDFYIPIDMTASYNIYMHTSHAYMYMYIVYNEGTKVQNPRHLCHVHCINIHDIYTAIYMYIRGQMRECTGKYTEIWQRQKL